MARERGGERESLPRERKGREGERERLLKWEGLLGGNLLLLRRNKSRQRPLTTDKLLLDQLLLAQETHHFQQGSWDGRPVATLQVQLILLDSSSEIITVPRVKSKLHLEELLLGASGSAKVVEQLRRLPVDGTRLLAVESWEREGSARSDLRREVTCWYFLEDVRC